MSPARKRFDAGTAPLAKPHARTGKSQSGDDAKTGDPSAVGFGYLTVAADPFALVRIDGKEVGSTPIFGRKLPVGKHRIVLTDPETGRIRLRRTIDIKADKTEKVIAD